jgi:hypothetical protein
MALHVADVEFIVALMLVLQPSCMARLVESSVGSLRRASLRKSERPQGAEL